MSFRFPYLSVDIETTGVDLERSHVLQLAAVYDDGRPLEELPTFNRVVRWKVITYGEEYAMNLNRHLLEKTFSVNDDYPTISAVQAAFGSFLYQVQPEGKITPAGKNVAAFDVPILKNPTNGFAWRRFNRRALDPGSMYTEEFDHIPSLGEINKYLGREAVTHDALDDCWDVVHAIRHKWGVRNG